MHEFSVCVMQVLRQRPRLAAAVRRILQAGRCRTRCRAQLDAIRQCLTDRELGRLTSRTPRRGGLASHPRLAPLSLRGLLRRRSPLLFNIAEYSS